MYSSIICSVLLLTSVMLSSCATTTAPTESSTHTFDKTTNAALDATSSTSPGSSGADAATLERFATENYAALKLDMARGRGEYLQAVAALLGVAPEQEKAFFATVQKNFTELYAKDNTSPADIVTQLDNILSIEEATL